MSPATQGRGAEEARHLQRSRSAIPTSRATIPTWSSARRSGRRRAPRGRGRLGLLRRRGCNGPVDRSDWAMTPQTNDAYNGSLRDIVFPAGILQPPMFDANADPAINYGAIGGVIGHELTHGFDDQGRKIDADGRAARLVDARRTPATFEARAEALGAQYSRLRAAARRARQRRPDHGREHRRPRRPDARARRLPRLAARQAGAGDRRPDRRPARLPRLGAGLARQGARRLRAQAGGQRSALAARSSASTASCATSTPGTPRSA